MNAPWFHARSTTTNTHATRAAPAPSSQAMGSRPRRSRCRRPLGASGTADDSAVSGGCEASGSVAGLVAAPAPVAASPSSCAVMGASASCVVVIAPTRSTTDKLPGPRENGTGASHDADESEVARALCVGMYVPRIRTVTESTVVEDAIPRSQRLTITVEPQIVEFEESFSDRPGIGQSLVEKFRNAPAVGERIDDAAFAEVGQRADL